MKITELYDLSHTIAGEYLSQFEYPWEALGGIKEFVTALGKTLDPDVYEEVSENVWIAKNAKVFNSAYITGPTIIDEGAEIRQCAFIRGSAIVGKNTVLGNSCELKNSILFDNVQVPHFNYVGDSILGYKSHMGAGSITSNVKSDKTNVVVRGGGIEIATGLKKFGAMVGDNTEVGCQAVLCPGTVLGKNCTIYPTSMVRGYIEENSIYKSSGNIVKKK